MIIVDTNVISDLMRQEPAPAVVAWFNRQRPAAIRTTAITILEIRYGLGIKPDGRKRSMLEAAFERMLNVYFPGCIEAFDVDAAECAAQLQARMRRIGAIADPADCMIAGVALSRGATLATRNVKHFADSGIRLVNPFDPATDT